MYKPTSDFLGDSTITYQQYCKNASIIQVDPYLNEFPVINSAALATYRINRLYYYWKRFVRLMLERSPDLPAAFAIFTKDGELAGLKGDEDTIQELELAGIKEGTFWDIEHAGPNAVTFGLKEKQRLFTIGDENYNNGLKRFALYFVPLIIRMEIPPYELNDLGGIAIMTLLKDQSPQYLLTLNCMAHDLALNIQFSQITNLLFDQNNDGVISVDNLTNDEPGILYCNKNAYDILGVRDENLRFHALSELIDPLPENKAFWDIVHNIKCVKDRHMTISSRGKKISCILTSDNYNQKEMLRMSGSLIFLTTDSRISAKVSEKMANNAIMSFNNIVGEHPRMLSTIRKGRLLASTQSNIMLMGESGVGKDVFAQAIHNESDRRDKPFIAINCGALPRDLIASELFGYDAGAFTGAKKNGNIGKFELANGGTIFLDEIGELPLDLQATLLRIVEQKRFMRLGSSKEIEVDVKIISATNVDIPTMIQEKKFRADLYYRLSTMLLEIPPLRERGTDILRLTEHILSRICQRIGREDVPVLSREAQELMLQLTWPGNVRELQNTVERMVQLYPDNILLPEHIMDCVGSGSLMKAGINQEYPAFSHPAGADKAETGTGISDQSAASSTSGRKPRFRSGPLTREQILEALAICNDNRTEAAKYLGIARKTLYRNMERLGM